MKYLRKTGKNVQTQIALAQTATAVTIAPAKIANNMCFEFGSDSRSTPGWLFY
ncbi:hypothetical protein [Mucilaginibacter ginsenosidivorans]|uniref:hypothetical protein n=1 Tax=Mucilaginibacter ginsenosidivorans TaxID=398053 RepID=UPI001651DB9C|nr:hypothetical protein [Mucilaginibacter ginsenosidivorans]